MKILSIFHSFSMGGMQNRFLQLLNHTEFQKWDHHILALDGNYELVTQTNTPTTLLKGFNYKKHDIMHNLIEFRKLYKNGNFDLVQTHNWATIEAVMANTPRIMPHLHNEDGFGSDESKKLNFKRNIIRCLFLKGKHLCVPSQTLLNIAQEKWNVKNIHYIPNGIKDYGEYDFISSPDKLILGTTCILRPEKNIFRFIDFLKKLLDRNIPVKGIIIGDGGEKDRLVDYANSLGLIKSEIEFLGYHPAPQDILKDIDIFVLTSDTEQQPYSILEAMNLSKPILSTNVGDVFNMVSPENQKFVANHHFETLNQDLIEFLVSKKAQQSIGYRNRAWQKSYYDINNMYIERIKLIHKIAHNN